MQAKRPSDRNQPQSINVGAPAASARPSPLRVPRPCAAYGLRAGGGLRAGVGLRRRARLLQSRPHHRQSVARPKSTAVSPRRSTANQSPSRYRPQPMSDRGRGLPCASRRPYAGGGLRAGGRVAAPQSRPHHRQSVARPKSTAVSPRRSTANQSPSRYRPQPMSDRGRGLPCASRRPYAGGGLRAGGRVAAPQSRPHHRQSVAEPLSTAARSRPLGALCFGRAPRAVRRSSPPPFGPPPLRWRRPCPLPRNKQQRIFLSPRSALYAPPSLAPPQKGLGAGRFVRSARRDRSTVADRPFLLLSSAGACVVGAWGGQSPRASSPPPAHLGRR